MSLNIGYHRVFLKSNKTCFLQVKTAIFQRLEGNNTLPNKNISFKEMDFILQMVYNVVVILCNFKVG